MPKFNIKKKSAEKAQTKPARRQVSRITVDRPFTPPLFVSLSAEAYDGLALRAKQEKRTIRAQAILTLENVYGEIEVKTSNE